MEAGGIYYFRVRADTRKLVLTERTYFDGYGCHADAVAGVILP
jgi:hypothetical protein